MKGKRRYSIQRELILDELSKSMEHPTAEELFSSLRKNYPHISLGTVYRNLKLLSDEKIITKMNFSVERFDFDIIPHPHFRCDLCGRVSDMRSFSHNFESIACSDGREISRCDVIFSGICEKCIEKRSQ